VSPVAFLIRDATAADHAAVLALNLESEAMLAPMDAAHLGALEAKAAYHRVAIEDDAVSAFLLAFREGADYDSPNYRWFSERYDRFLYVDRVAVSAEHQGRGLGASLYANLFAFARAHDVPRVVCEYYSEPMNLASQAFHARMGFVEVGSQWLPERGKRVSYQVAELQQP
jgi:predicted GNAT superfamily acetyltransferase